MPLEKILGLEDMVDEDEVDLHMKKTWRPGFEPEAKVKKRLWTAGQIMEGWAIRRGFSQSSLHYNACLMKALLTRLFVMLKLLQRLVDPI